jgi:hypothetical protein
MLKVTSQKRLAIVAGLFSMFIGLGGCARRSSTLSARINPINAYRAYGDYHPTSEDESVVVKASSVTVGAEKIRIFQEALPPGVTMDNGVLGVEKGEKHRLIGKFAYSTGQDVSKDTLVLQVKKMCVATNANAAMVIFQLIPNDHQDQAQGVEAVLMSYDSE